MSNNVKIVDIDIEDGDREIYAGTCNICEEDVCDNCGDCHNPACRECEDLACYMWQFKMIQLWDMQQLMKEGMKE